jgi:ComF family protein
MNIFKDILNIIFPKVCCICDRGVTKNEDLICFRCRSNLPKTNLLDVKENELLNRFHGRIKVDFGLSYLYFYKSGITQKLLHQFKYNSYPEVGELIGRWVGHELIKSKIYKQIDIIIPVPLHPRKERKRGYNQSQYFAKGISEITKIPTDFKTLSRAQYDVSLTNKSRVQRWKSVVNAFRVIDNTIIDSKNILLVDDVITTGATLEVCGNQLLKNGANSLGIATMAIAK